MRKSSLVLLLAMAFVLTTVVAAFSADSICKRCEYDTKDGQGWSYGLQIDWVVCDTEEQGVVCPCPTFDYELGSAQSGTDFCDGGYCANQSVNGVLMKLCDCEAVINGDVQLDKAYALRLTIMSPASGVYWTDRDYTNPNNPHDCSVDCDGDSIVTNDGDQFVYVSSHEVSDPAKISDYCVTSCEATNGDFALTYTSATAGQDFVAQDCTKDCCFTCDNNAVKSIKTCNSKFLGEKNPLLLIDMPEFIYDPTDPNVALGGKVEVKIELIGECGDICTSSKVFCECVVDVGTFTDCVKDVTCDLCLPYLVGNGFGDAWWTGIALTNATKVASDVVITYVADGVVLTQAVAVPAQSVKSFVLSTVEDLDTLPAGKPIYAQVKSSSSLNAFVMIGNGMEAQGYLGLCGECGCGAAAGCSNMPDE